MEMVLEADTCELSEGPEERDFLAQLHDLDNGLADGDRNTAVRLLPALEARLMRPLPPRESRPSPPRESRLRNKSEELPFLRELGQVEPLRPTLQRARPSRLFVTVTLMLLMMLGEAGAVLVFHERLSHVAFQLETLTGGPRR